jgi:dTMP kinase
MVVISDRYADATSAYQGAARKLPGNKLQELHKIATGGLKPDMTFLLDLPAATGLERARKRNKAAGCEDRFENENIGFHEKVRRGYLDIARDEPERVAVIDAAGTEDAVFNRIVTEFERRRERLCGGK